MALNVGHCEGMYLSASHPMASFFIVSLRERSTRTSVTLFYSTEVSRQPIHYCEYILGQICFATWIRRDCEWHGYLFWAAVDRQLIRCPLGPLLWKHCIGQTSIAMSALSYEPKLRNQLGMYFTRICEEIRRIQKGVWVEGKSVGFGRCGVHEGRDRAEVGSGKGEFVSHHGGDSNGGRAGG